MFVQKREMASDIDLFDRLCFKRMFLRAWRHNFLSARPLTGMLYKAMRGTLCKAWERRLFELRGNVLAYYRNGDRLLKLMQEVAKLRSRLLAARRDGSALPLTDAGHYGTAATAGSLRAMLPAAAAAAAVAAGPETATIAAVLRACEKELDKVRSTSYRRSFHIIPGRTEVVIPSTAAATFPTPYVLQLVNPAVADLPALSSSRSPASGAGPGGPGVDTAERAATAAAIATASAAMAAMERTIGGAERDVLTLCADTSQERREWVVYFKARLRSHDFPQALNRLYLTRAPDDGHCHAGGGER
jgi:hypothetical protein